MPKISVMFGSNVESEYTLKKDEIKIGRAMDCDIVVDNLGVSRHHCTIVHEGDDWVVVDGGSNNGTYVGGQKIKRHALKHADRVVLGKHSLLYDAHGEAEGAADKTGKPKKTQGGMGGEMTMFVDQAQLAKVMSTKRMGLSLMQGGRELLVPLIREETTMGASGADVPAKGFLVKPIQAKVVKAGEGHRIISLGGWRGVYVNGQKVTSHELKSGDIITIASSTLTYKQA